MPRCLLKLEYICQSNVWLACGSSFTRCRLGMVPAYAVLKLQCFCSACSRYTHRARCAILYTCGNCGVACALTTGTTRFVHLVLKKGFRTRRTPRARPFFSHRLTMLCCRTSGPAWSSPALEPQARLKTSTQASGKRQLRPAASPPPSLMVQPTRRRMHPA